jgi:prevent-host-death family protein
MSAQGSELSDRHPVSSHDKGFPLVEAAHDFATLVTELSLGDLSCHGFIVARRATVMPSRSQLPARSPAVCAFQGKRRGGECRPRQGAPESRALGTPTLGMEEHVAQYVLSCLGMTRIGVRELRQNASRYLRMVKAGQRVEVTERGRLVALLVSPRQEEAARDRLVASGRLIPAAGPFQPPVRRRLLADGPSASETLRESREDRLA